MQAAVTVFQKTQYPEALVWGQHTSLEPSMMPSALMASLQQRSSLSPTEQASNTSCSHEGKKMLTKKRSLLFQYLGVWFYVALHYSLGWKVPGARVGQETGNLWTFRWVKGYLALLLLSVEKVQLWCCSAQPSPTSDERKEVAHAAVVLVLLQTKMSGWKELITSWYPYWGSL